MTNFGFVIDNQKCIGCHACSTACKSENEVPLGVNRTWVKYVEAGIFPDSRRFFQVTRCNHCANPPCVRICPVTAMYQRSDGIVEFDSDICIGCKACMQACPYDAIYIDPNTNTAAKCHFCGHRTEIGLEPACVVVCPVHAIIAGDMDDSSSEISHVLAHNQVTVRKPEQGTAPKLFYINGNDIVLHPTTVERVPETYMWADVIPLHQTPHNTNTGNSSPIIPISEIETRSNYSGFSNNQLSNKQSNSGASLRRTQPQGTPWNGPIQLGSRVADHMIQVAYNAQHKIPWHWPVPTYLVTKGIGSGLFILLGIGSFLGLFHLDHLTAALSSFITLLFIGITTGLLIYDLDRPERFLSIIFRPQWNSWLARGAYLLIIFSFLTILWWLVETGAYFKIISSSFAMEVRPFFLWAGFPFAIGAATYTAFLFGQAEGRDLWQSSLLPLHLLIQATMVGSGALLIMNVILEVSSDILSFARICFITSLLIDIFVTLFGEFGMPHASEIAAKAAHDISHGNYKNYFWYGSIIIGHLVPGLFFLMGNSWLGAISAITTVVGLYAYEFAFVMAPQDISNS